MCGIAGFLNFRQNYFRQREEYQKVLNRMCSALYHRGPDENGTVLSGQYGLAHTRLSIIDLEHGKQPMSVRKDGNTYYIVYNGEIYNTDEIRTALITKGWKFQTTSDTEVILAGFICFGIRIVRMLNGIFAFLVVDEKKQEAYLVRDPVGVKPLYYTKKEETLVFSSEIKGIFSFPGIRPKIGRRGWNEVLGLGPAKTYGSGVFEEIHEVKPGYYLKISRDGVSEQQYFKLQACEHSLSYEETVEKTRELVTDAIRRQMVSDVPVATFLSGGVDSSIVSAVCAGELKKQGKKLNTFSFDFVDNDKYFTANSFQPSEDRPFVKIMTEAIGSSHHNLFCSNKDLFENLFSSVDGRDLPTMADVDSSMLYFCQLVKPYNKVVLTGECADEIFGGYPWFYKKECFEAETFPWSMDLSARQTVLKEEVIEALQMEEYIKEAYQKTIDETPVLPGENPQEKRRREIAYLNIKWFMQTLLDRMDRTSMYSGLEARVPFADIRILQFLFNVPWQMKTRDGIEKYLLRDAMRGILPEEILFRKKSPYPKTYDPAYEKLLGDAVKEIIQDPRQPINQLVDDKKVLKFIDEKKDYGKPWYGQLMAGPQMLAYLLQINYWMKKYGLGFS